MQLSVTSKEIDVSTQMQQLLINVSKYRQEQANGDKPVRAQSAASEKATRTPEEKKRKGSARIELVSPVGGLPASYQREDQNSFSGTFLHQTFGMPPTLYRGRVETSGRLESSCEKCSHSASTGHNPRPCVPPELHAPPTKATLESKQKTRIRFLSADHVSPYVNDKKRGPRDRRKTSDGANSVKRSQKTETEKIFVGANTDANVERFEHKVETPEVWLQRARKLRSTKGSRASKQLQAKRANSTDRVHTATLTRTEVDSATISLSRANFCDIRKHARILKWLEEVNAQRYFDVVEQ